MRDFLQFVSVWGSYMAFSAAGFAFLVWLISLDGDPNDKKGAYTLLWSMYWPIRWLYSRLIHGDAAAGGSHVAWPKRAAFRTVREAKDFLASKIVALPMFCSAYVGMAEAAAEKTLTFSSAKVDDVVNALVIGEMLTELTSAQIALQSLISNANELDVVPGIEHANRALIHKTIISEAVKHTAEKALEATGGAGYFRRLGIERILRDTLAVQFHPMPAKKQHRFTGRLAMGLDPLV